MGKIIRRTLTALLIVIFALSAAIVGAKIQMYTATGEEDYANEIESQDIAKLRARDKAIKKATKQAGVYLKSYSRSVNSELTDDEVTAITSNAWQLVSEPKYSSKIVKGSDETSIIIWTATVEVNVDDSEIQSWIKRDSEDKTKIINQTREAQKASEENDRKIEDLREKYNRATSQAEKDSLRKQMSDADRDFLANQKLEEGIKLSYSKNYEGAINFFNEAIELNPNYASAYINRGIAYIGLNNFNQPIEDATKAIEINPNNLYNNYMAYLIRGACYSALGEKTKSKSDFATADKLRKKITKSTSQAEKDKIREQINKTIKKTYDIKPRDYKRVIKLLEDAIELDPNYAETYERRGWIYYLMKEYVMAIQDYSKAIELNPNYGEVYYHRGETYNKLEQYERAIQDFDKAIELPNNIFASSAEIGRKSCYQSIFIRIYKNLRFSYTIQEFDKIIETNPNFSDAYYGRALFYVSYYSNFNQAISDLTKAIELNSKNVMYYQMRGLCYQALYEHEKAQADFAKAKELVYWSRKIVTRKAITNVSEKASNYH